MLRSLTLVFAFLHSACFLLAQTSVTILPNGTDTVYAGSVRTLYSFVCPGKFSLRCKRPSNADVRWNASGGTLDTSSAPEYVRWTAPAHVGTYTVTANSSGVTDSKTFRVISDDVLIDTVPFNITLFRGQSQIIQPIIEGTTNLDVTWSVKGPAKANVLSTTSQQAVFTSSTPGVYVVTATSVADKTKSSSTYVTVTPRNMPPLPLLTKTEPVDCSAASAGKVYEVNDDASFDAVPWKTLKPGDLIRLHWSPTPIHRIGFLGFTSGTRDKPIRMCGVYDPAHGLPQISGVDASVVPAFGNASFFAGGTEGLEGLFLFGIWDHYNNSGRTPANGFFLIEGIQFGHAISAEGSGKDSPGASFRTVESHGSARHPFSIAAACLAIRNGHDIVLRGNEMVDCGNTAFIMDNNAVGSHTAFYDFQGNWLHQGSSTNTSQTQHTAYLQGEGAVIQGNYFDQRRNGGTGTTLKTRILREYIRFNYFAPGARILDLVEPEDLSDHTTCSFCTNVGAGGTGFTSADLARMEEAYYSFDWVYGNIIANDAVVAAPSPFHYSADDSPGLERDATLLFYHNTYYDLNTESYHQDQISMSSGGTASIRGAQLFAEPYADLANNAIYITPLGRHIYAFGYTHDNRINLRKNFVSPSWCRPSFFQSRAQCGKSLADGLGVSLGAPEYSYQRGDEKVRLTGISGIVSGSDIPFDAKSFVPNAGSQLVHSAGTLHPAAQSLPPNMQYDMTRFVMVRRGSAADMGAVSAP